MTSKNVVYFYSVHVYGYLHEAEAMYEYSLLCTLQLCTVLFLGALKHRILIFLRQNYFDPSNRHPS